MSHKNRGISSLHCRRNPVMHVTDRRRPACQKSKNCRKRLPGASNEFRTEPGQRPADVADRRNCNSRLLLRRASRLAVFQSGRLWRAVIHPLNTPDRPQPTRHRRLRTHGSGHPPAKNCASALQSNLIVTIAVSFENRCFLNVVNLSTSAQACPSVPRRPSGSMLAAAPRNRWPI